MRGLVISNSVIEPQLLSRIQNRARDWSVSVEEKFETDTSVIVFGRRDRNPVVLKVVKQTGDEWLSGEILEEFDGNGVVRVYEHVPGAVLMERLQPGNSLVEMALNGRDEEATSILTVIIQRMATRTSSVSPDELPKSCPTVHDWAKGFERYITSGDAQIPIDLVEAGQRTFLDLCASQREPRLLHGDLQHYNVLFDSDRGWLAIDPKGVIGELEYEIGAVLRDPVERPDLFLSASAIERRVNQFTSKLHLNRERVLSWAFAQAVLSAICEIEDGFAVDASNSSLRLAQMIRPMLGL